MTIADLPSAEHSIAARQMVTQGIGMGLEAERKIAQVFKRKEFTIAVHLGLGTACAHMWTTDLSYDYVRINASYRS